jgi:hypothetical protein
MIRAQIKGLALDFSGQQILTLTLDKGEDFRQKFDELNGKNLSIEVKEYRPKRSLNANNYAWQLITKLADTVRMSKDDMYFCMLKEYGQSEMISVKSGIDITPYLKYFEVAGETTLNGKDFTHYKVYKGSSEFDTREMSVFIDGIVQECKNVGIETMTPDEILKMESLWK